MTTCFVAQIGPFCLAAADTRISAEGSTGLPSSIWDAADLPFTTDAGHVGTIPYRFRKIRKLDRGWAVIAGSFVTGDRMLNLLSREEAASANQASEILTRRASEEIAVLESSTSLDSAQIYTSFLLGVPATVDRTGVWCAQLDRTTGYTVTELPNFAINWPLSVPTTLREEAQQAFAASLSLMPGAAGVIRAAAALIGAARSVPDSSPIVQIGLTWQSSPTDYQARYFHGHIDEIAGMTNDEIASRWETLQP